MAQAVATYYQGAGVAARERIQLFRLAWDVVGDSFASRQQLNEREFLGDPVHLMAAQYREYDTSTAVSKVRALLDYKDAREHQT
jgi:4-hydroxyphenylacetate 3-monooxygenase